jgi:L-lysine 2,3-aminomutase
MFDGEADLPPRAGGATPSRYRAIGPHHLDRIGERYGLDAEQLRVVNLHAQVLPFRTNSYVLDQLIDWSVVPDDPIFQMVFPQPGMLSAEHEDRVRRLQARPARERAAGIAAIRAELNPHPSGQRELNVPSPGQDPLQGVQHKYAQTVLYFPAQGQTCHAYCTYCFRWAQFVGDADLRFAAPDPQRLVAYLHHSPDVTDVLVTGGDPLVMSTERLRGHLDPLLGVPTVTTIRLGTKALAYWPARFTTDADADALLRLLEQVVASGRTAAVMAHVSHPRELATDEVRLAIRRILGTGARIYTQAPIMRRINDDAHTWRELWSTQLSLGAVPYYMFMARDTGPREYFEVPIARAVTIFGQAQRDLSGLARTVRGPVMSTSPGKLVIDGQLGSGGRHYVARFLQARDTALVGRPFQVTIPAGATWADAIHPAPGTPANLVEALASIAPDAAADGGAA